ncbi:DMT family transporter [Microbacterium suwonense]|uniref:Cation transporter n=1 Tax=Microbacterium suwonense TaxID=683047 RepID=A0ABN6X3M0_9MICO|nr:SMR family transporter [Microbacterium suwonense]BDZ39299.1 cation transporter [Microbacterium suwonense]
MMWFVLAGAIACEVAATLALNASKGFEDRRYVAPVTAGYTAAYLLLWAALAMGMPVGIAYGIWAGVGVAVVVVLAKVLFGDDLPPRMIFGIGLIVAGVVIIHLE